jgi:hypothetical protein
MPFGIATTHQPKAFLAVFIQDNGKPFQENDTLSFPELLQQWIEDIYMGLRVDFLGHSLI